jgi:hypothetical protein
VLIAVPYAGSSILSAVTTAIAVLGMLTSMKISPLAPACGRFGSSCTTVFSAFRSPRESSMMQR